MKKPRVSILTFDDLAAKLRSRSARASTKPLLQGLRRPARTRLRLSMYAPLFIWFAAAILVSAIVWRLQVAHRSPLVWDEAVRVDAGAALAHVIRGGDLPGVWQWIHGQVFYPFLEPALNGVVLLATNDPITAAWVPSLVAYALAGLLAGRLTAELSGSATAAWCAALLTWLTPLEAREAAGGFTEPIGACLLLVLLIALVRMSRQDGLLVPVSAGLAAALCWFLKYDYGILALGTIGLSGLAAVASSRRRVTYLRQYGVAMAAAIAPIAAWFTVNPTNKLRGFSEAVGLAAPGSTGQADLGYLPRALLIDHELGLTPVLAVLFLVAIVWATTQVRRRAMQAPLICLLLWYLIYTAAAVTYSRYMGVIVPLLAVFAGLCIGRFLTDARIRSLKFRRVILAVVAVVAAGQLALQAAGSGTGLSVQYWFLAPDPPAADALKFASSQLSASDGSVLMLGQSNEFSPFALHVAWTQRLGRPAPPVYGWGESENLTFPPILKFLFPQLRQVPQAATGDSLAATIDTAGSRQVVGVDVGSGSRLDTLDYRTKFRSHSHFIAVANELEAEGLLRRVATLSTERGRLEVIVWTYLRSQSIQSPLRPERGTHR